ncbi:hypothetical protein Scep_003712 [Stephania cephalantha]|uniref:Uncharacterized protein n=1 Tax=Stephania cephalantha TaxID=152367 RepID=A0AAP0KR13_9MAGN
MGYVQRILRDPYRPMDADHRKGHLESVEQNDEKTDYPYQVSSDYMEWYIRVSHPFAEDPEHATTFKCTLKVNPIVDDAFQMADQLIAFLSGAEHTYQSTTATISQSKGGTTSNGDVLHYGRKEKRPLENVNIYGGGPAAIAEQQQRWRQQDAEQQWPARAADRIRATTAMAGAEETIPTNYAKSSGVYARQAAAR